MSKLTEFCQGIYDAIKSVNPEIGKLNAQDFADSIRTLSSSGGGGSVETCEVTVIGSSSSGHYPTNIAYTSVDSSGKVIGIDQSVSTSSVTITCVKGSTLAVKYKSILNFVTVHMNASLLFYTSPVAVYKLDDDATTATIENSASSNGGSIN